MIHLVNSANRPLYTQEIAALHRARKSVFVDQLGWKLNVRDGMESDEYDDNRACSLIGFTSAYDVAMSVRVRPTDDRSMLADHFSHTLRPGSAPINDGQTWEVSRGFCREIGRKRHNLRRKAACMLGPLEVALLNGATRLVGFSDVRMLTFFMNVGWCLTFLGEAVSYGEGDGFAYEVTVSADAIATMRRKWSLPDPAYVYFSNEMAPINPLIDYERQMRLLRPELGCLAPS